jgi:plastocyanin
MTRNQRIGLIVAAVIVAVVGFLIASPGNEDDAAEQAAQTTPTQTETETETETETTTAETGGAEAPRAAKVEIVDFTFSPATTTVQVGGKVNWANEDTAPHTATAENGSFDTGNIEPDKRGNATFKQAGTFRYICAIHPDMKGTVEVVE